MTIDNCTVSWIRNCEAFNGIESGSVRNCPCLHFSFSRLLVTTEVEERVWGAENLCSLGKNKIRLEIEMQF